MQPTADLTYFETKRRRDNRKVARLGSASFVIHAIIIVGAVYATRTAQAGDYTVKADTTMVLLTAQEKPPAPQQAELDVPLKGFQTIVVPTQVPSDIPPINVQEQFDPKDYTGVGVEGGHANGVLVKQVYSETNVEERPILLSSPPLAYPDFLRREGIQGRVLLQAIVDTTGRVEPASIKILKSPNSGFDQPTRDWVLKALFRPARLHGEAVRVLINLPVDYAFSSSPFGR